MSSVILIIDDDELGSEMFGKRLEKRGFVVHIRHSGAGILSELEGLKPDLMLLDIVMPEIDGNKVLQTLREKFNHIVLPVMMLTSKDEVEDVVQSLKLGANDFLTKPANIDIAMARINSLLETKKLYFDSLKKTELETLNAMIVTYNHEINNPLAAAVGYLDMAKSSKEEKYLEKTGEALKRITDIVAKIQQLTQKDSVETESYAKSSKDKLIKIG